MKVSKRVRGRLLLACSVGAVCGFSSVAHAQCAPDPTVTGVATDCPGTDSNGLVVTTVSNVSVPTGGTVTNSGTPAITVAIPGTTIGDKTSILVSGTVDGAGSTGIAAITGAAGYYYSAPNVAVTVGQGGTVTGSTAITAGNMSGTNLGFALVALDNSGTVTGTTGAALATGNGGAFSSIVNRTGGLIGGISGAVGTIQNQGTIAGGSTSAIAGGTYSTLAYTSSLTNAGSITSSGSSATVADYSGPITNSGTIANSGTGSAIIGNYGPITNNVGGLITAGTGDTISLTGSFSIDNAGTIANTGSGRAIVGSGGITNRAGGTISAAATAIDADYLYLTNRGSIVGNIRAGSSASSNIGSNIDSTAGSINGNVTFGAGEDTLFATYSNAGDLNTGITGLVDGGAGRDTIQAKFAADATLSSAIVLPTNFEIFSINSDSSVTVTLDKGFSVPGELQFTSGTLVNRTDLSGSGRVVFSTGIGASFRNEGSITGTAMPNQPTVQISGNTFTNTGTISSQGDAVSSFVSSFTNSGTITAAGTAVSAFDEGSFDNSGTIRSTGGTGLTLWGSSYGLGYSAINSGTIEGPQAGVNLSTTLTNTGLITSDNTGVALNWYGVLYNKAGGVVSGGIMAIAPSQSMLFNGAVINEGAINGDVSIASNSSYYPGNNVFYALSGGTLNGNLTLGWGDTLVTDIQNSGTSQFAGINGTVTASRSNLRYMVSQDTSATVRNLSGFSSIGYDLYNGATLTLTGNDVQTGTMTFAGNGNAVLDVDFYVVAQPAILHGSVLTPFTSSSVPDSLSITSKGTITLSRVVPYSYYGSAVSLGSEDTFTNEGVITVTDTSGQSYYPLSAVSGGTVINSGTITVNNGVGVNAAQSLTNSGTITATGAAAIDIQNTITNSGTLASTGGAAIANSSYSPYSLTVDNQVGGTISGNGSAIQLQGGTVSNAGTIQGTVDLGYSPYYGRSNSSGVYVASGGTLTGDLLFGSGNDALVETGSGYGVTGTIDGGDGFDYIGHERSQSATVTLGGALPATFEGEFVSSRGKDTVLTIAANGTLDGNIIVAGDGQIVNEASTHGSVTGLGYPFGTLPYFDVTLAAFTNKAQIDGQITLNVSSLSNSGTVGSAALSSPAVSQTASGSLSFDNSGTLTSGNSLYYSGTILLQGSDLASAAITNSGTIAGNGLQAQLAFDGTSPQAKGSFGNNGTISGLYGIAVNASAAASDAPAPFSLDFVNSGTIESTAFAGAALTSTISGTAAISITNSGTIRASGDGYVSSYYYWGGYCFLSPWSCFPSQTYTTASVALGSYNGNGVIGSSVATTITNEAGGLIEATGAISAAIRSDGPLTLVNAGTITGTGGYTVDPADLSAGIYGTTRFAGAVQTFGTGSDSIVNSGTINGSIDLAGGNDSIVNTGTINGDVFLGDGDDRFTQRLSATLTGMVDGGDGSDTLVTDLTGGGTLDAAYYGKFTSFENFALTGTGTLSVNGILPVQTLTLEVGSTFELAAGSTLQTLGVTALTGTDGTEHVINRGTIVGNVALGGGDDVFEAYAGSSVTGAVDGGTGSDRLAFHLDPAAGRTAIDLQPYTSFEQLVLESGTGTLSDQASFDTIAVEGGRLIGLAGSTITARSGITVASGATFGSAGTVNGNIVVNGTLSPGASPETMTVNGNVTLAAGSSTLFEMTPTISDTLIINGGLTIASGTTLSVVGERPLTPGVRYHLITTTDGIKGSFSTISKVSTVHGFIIQTADNLDLLGALELHAGASKPVTVTAAYLNTLLVDGIASDQLVAALPQLTAADGYVDAAKMATLHPEAYAVASQIGIDNGLSISSALRSSQRMGEGGSRFFTLGQGLGSWQDLRGSSTAGTADAHQNSGGFLCGLGYQAGKLAVSVVLGRIYADQSEPTLGASTKAHGTFAGASASFVQGGLDLGGSVIWDGSSATTRRALFDGSTVTGRYNLHSLTFDAHGGYGFALGKGGWRLGPELGLTHVRVKRGEAQETGDAVFALDVASRKQNATFLSADLRLDMAPSARMRPWLTMGWRHRLGGDATLATAGLPGVSEQFTVAGAQRDRDHAQIGGGFDWTVTSGVTLFARGSTAFTRASGVTNVTGGVRLSF